jgi:uncharacterized membrane protein
VSHSPSPQRREVSRIEGFSDAVFAFAVTLLVVSLEVPHTFDELWAAMRQFFAFAICFALLFQVWWRHFNFFRRYGLEDVPTIVLTGILLFVVLFYVYPLKFVFTLVVNQIIGVPSSHDGTGGPVIRNADTPRLMQIYSGGVVAVFSMFALMYANAFRQRVRLGLDARQQLEARLNIIDNAGIALIGVASVLVATLGGPLAAAAIAGPMYFLIGPFKWGLGWYSAKAYKRLETLNTADTSSV